MDANQVWSAIVSRLIGATAGARRLFGCFSACGNSDEAELCISPRTLGTNTEVPWSPLRLDWRRLKVWEIKDDTIDNFEYVVLGPEKLRGRVTIWDGRIETLGHRAAGHTNWTWYEHPRLSSISMLASKFDIVAMEVEVE